MLVHSPTSRLVTCITWHLCSRIRLNFSKLKSIVGQFASAARASVNCCGTVAVADMTSQWRAGTRLRDLTEIAFSWPTELNQINVCFWSKFS